MSTHAGQNSTAPQSLNVVQNLTGKVALVTGGSRGIGRGIALRLAERGAAVAVNYNQNEAAARDTVERARTHGVEAFAVQADVSSTDEIADMIRRVHDRFGNIDVFVNNALGDCWDL